MGLPPVREAGQLMDNCDRHTDNRRAARQVHDDADTLRSLGQAVARDENWVARPVLAADADPTAA